MQLYLNEIMDLCYNGTRQNPNLYRRGWWDKRGASHIYDHVMDVTSFLEEGTPWKIRLWHYENNILKVPTCKKSGCNNPVTWNTHNYQTYCSIVCNNTSEEFIEKRKATTLEKYGTTEILSDPTIRKKIAKTNIEKYGVDNPLKSKQVQERIEKTNLKRYGVSNPLLNDEIQEKKRITNNERYGADNPLASTEIRDKINTTVRDRYGVENINHRHISPDILAQLDDVEWITNEYQTKSITTMANEMGVSISCIRGYLSKAGIVSTFITSSFENEVYEYIKSLTSKDIIRSDRKVLKGKELDIYIPDMGLAFECNGTYWHSELGGHKDKNYHLNKTVDSRAEGVTLIHIWQHEWDQNLDLMKSRVRSIMGGNDRLYARKTTVIKPSREQVVEFLKANHIQGYCQYKHAYALEYNGEMVSLMTFGKSRYNKNIPHELLRYCNRAGLNVVGGASRLLKQFTRENDGNIISYCDRMRNTGNLYSMLGFELEGDSPPSFQYTKDYSTFHNRQNFQKHLLENKLEEFNPVLTEWQNMANNGYDRIWNCGNSTWVYKC